MSTAILIFIPFLIAVLLVAMILLYARNRRQAVQTAIQQAKEAALQIVPQLIPVLEDEDKAACLWLETLLKQGYIEPLCQSGSMLILGTPQMGSSIIHKGVVRQTNNQFQQTGRMAIYLDAASITCTADLTGDTLPVQECFPEQIFRSIISSMVNPFMEQLEESIGSHAYLLTGISQLDVELKNSLAESIVDLQTASVAHALNCFWEKTGVSQVKLCLDNISAIQPRYLPSLSRMLMQTFGQSGLCDLIIGGKLDQLHLMEDTPQGPVGIQFGHDIFLGLNLQEILMPAIDENEGTILSGPRADFIQSILQESSPKLTLEQFANQTFNPPDTWKYLFHHYKGNLNKIHAGIQKIAASITSVTSGTSAKLDLPINKKQLIELLND